MLTYLLLGLVLELNCIRLSKRACVFFSSDNCPPSQLPSVRNGASCAPLSVFLTGINFKWCFTFLEIFNETIIKNVTMVYDFAKVAVQRVFLLFQRVWSSDRGQRARGLCCLLAIHFLHVITFLTHINCMCLLSSYYRYFRNPESRDAYFSLQDALNNE